MKRTIPCVILLCLFCFVIPTVVAQQTEGLSPPKVAVGPPPPSKAAPAASFQERLLATIPADLEKPMFGWSPAFSADGTQVAYVAKQQGKEFVVAGGQRGPGFRLVFPPVLSPDGRTVAYIAVPSVWGGAGNLTAYLMIGEKRVRLQEETPRVVTEALLPTFSPDGTRLAYSRRLGRREDLAVVQADSKVYKMKEKGEEITYIYGEGGPEFDQVGSPAFSPDGSRVAHWARQRSKWFIVIGRDRGREFEDVGHPVFSPDGKTVAYAAKQGKVSFVLVGEKRGPEFKEAGWPVFSPQGDAVAYVAKEEKKYFLLVGDKRGPEFEQIIFPVFSPDGSTVAYVAREGKKFFVMIGDKRGPEFGDAGLPVFSPDGSKVAYVACDCKMLARVLEGGLLGRAFGWTYDVEADVNGMHAKGGAGAGNVQAGALIARWHYRKGQEFIVVGDKVGPPFDSVTQPVFSTDGSKVAFGAMQGKELWWRVMEVR